PSGAPDTGMTTHPHTPPAPHHSSNCHANTAANFTAYTMNHAAVTGIACATCHNGSYASQGTAGALGLTTPPHIPTAALACSNCHTNTSTWTSYTMNHAAVAGTPRDSCHHSGFSTHGTAGGAGDRHRPGRGQHPQPGVALPTQN